MKRILIQGVKGCFHEQAARMFYKGYGLDSPEIVECLTFDDLYHSMDRGDADAAVMAVENTVSGGLLPNFELLRNMTVKSRGRSSSVSSRTLWLFPARPSRT